MSSLTALPLVTELPVAQSRTLLQTLDALPLLTCNALFQNAGSRVKWIACRAMSWTILLSILLFLTYMIRRGLGFLGGKGVTSEERAHSSANFLVRESARLVATALEKRGVDTLGAYEDAAQAAVLARTAKEVDVDVARLTKDLGVDFHEYLAYTNTVLQDLRVQMRREG